MKVHAHTRVIAAILCCFTAMPPVFADTAGNGARTLYVNCTFGDGELPLGEGAGNAVFVNCTFNTRSDTLFIAGHANGMVLLNCSVQGDPVLRWSRMPGAADRNYQFGLTANGREAVIEEGSDVTIELEGLPLADAFLASSSDGSFLANLAVIAGLVQPAEATRMELVMSDSILRHDSSVTAQVLTDAPLTDDFVGWHSSDTRVAFTPGADVMSCVLSVADCVVEPFDAVISAHGLSGIEAAAMIRVLPDKDDETPAGHDRTDSGKHRGWLGRLFGRRK